MSFLKINITIPLAEYKFAVEKATRLEIKLDHAYDEIGLLTEKIEELESDLEYKENLIEYYRNPQEELEELEDE